MQTASQKLTHQHISVPVAIEDLAESIWKLPRHDRETLEDLLEKRFVQTVLRRVKEIPVLRKKGKLLSFEQIKNEFTR